MNITLQPGHLDHLSRLRELHAELHKMSSGDPRYGQLSAEVHALSDSLVVSISAQVGSAIDPPVPHHWEPPVALKCPVYFDSEELKHLQRILDEASAKIADPDSTVFRLLDAVRTARRLASIGGQGAS